MSALERNARYRKTERGVYARHKWNAKYRGVEFLLTFEEWSAIWIASGKAKLRGCRPGFYAMCRRDDVGPYAVGNVYIGPHVQNFIDGPRNARAREFSGEPGDDVPF